MELFRRFPNFRPLQYEEQQLVPIDERRRMFPTQRGRQLDALRLAVNILPSLLLATALSLNMAGHPNTQRLKLYVTVWQQPFCYTSN
jgi:hypothetical protein